MDRVFKYKYNHKYNLSVCDVVQVPSPDESVLHSLRFLPVLPLCSLQHSQDNAHQKIFQTEKVMIFLIAHSQCVSECVGEDMCVSASVLVIV
jgi:hypothetical protein